MKKLKYKEPNKLTFQFIPHSDIQNLASGERIKRLLKVVLENKIVLLQGRLTPEEEARLIEDTMIMIDHVKGFKGIELAVISGNNRESIIGKMTKGIANALAGGDFSAMTIIGPATIVKEMKRNPKKIELLLNR